MENITIFIIGFVIFCAYVFTLFSIIIKSNNAQQRDLDNDPELKINKTYYCLTYIGNLNSFYNFI